MSTASTKGTGRSTSSSTRSAKTQRSTTPKPATKRGIAKKAVTTTQSLPNRSRVNRPLRDLDLRTDGSFEPQRPSVKERELNRQVDALKTENYVQGVALATANTRAFIVTAVAVVLVVLLFTVILKG